MCQYIMNCVYSPFNLFFFLLSFLAVFQFTWNEIHYINKIASHSYPFPTSRYWLTVQWRHQHHIKRQPGGEIKVISLCLTFDFLFYKLCIYSVSISVVFHFLSSYFPSSSVFTITHRGEINSQHTDAVQTWPLRPYTKDLAFSFSFRLSESLCAVWKELDLQNLQRLSIALASHLLLTWQWPSHPWDFLFPQVIVLPWGHLIKSVWGTSSTSSQATPLSDTAKTHIQYTPSFMNPRDCPN